MSQCDPVVEHLKPCEELGLPAKGFVDPTAEKITKVSAGSHANKIESLGQSQWPGRNQF